MGLPETNPCRKCGDEGHIVCRPNIHTLKGELYTVDCESGVACGNSTNSEHETEVEAISQWNSENPAKP